MNNIISHNLTNNSLVVVYSNDKGFHTKIVEDSHPNWQAVLSAYKKGNYDSVIDMLDVKTAISKKFDGKFCIQGEDVYYNGQRVSGYLFDRVIFFMRNNLPYERLIKFAENLYQNPSNRAREELYKFLEHKNMPITEDGCFLAYKGVSSNFWSKTGGTIAVLSGKVNASGQIYNGVGEQIVVERGDVDDNCNNTCSKGIHAGSVNYATDFAGSDGKIVIVKINPKDCVSVPTDCDGQKLRTCAYTVIGEEYRSLSDVRDINYDKGEDYQPDSGKNDYEVGYEDGYDDAMNERPEQPYGTEKEYVDGYTHGYLAARSEQEQEEDYEDDECCGDSGCDCNEKESGPKVSTFEAAKGNWTCAEKQESGPNVSNFQVGYDVGYDEGYDEGYEDGLNESNPIVTGEKKKVYKRDSKGKFCS